MKSYNDDARSVVMNGFWQCMLVLEKLRHYYSSADFAIQLLELAIQKADIGVVIGRPHGKAKIDVTRARKMSTAQPTSPSSDDLGPRQNDFCILKNPCQVGPLHDIDSACNLLETREEEFFTHVLPDSNTILPETNILYSNADFGEVLNSNASNHKMWNVPTEECMNGESGGPIGCVDWIDQALWWSPVEQYVTGGEYQCTEWTLWGGESER
jgi:hypothetical protein